MACRPRAARQAGSFCDRPTVALPGHLQPLRFETHLPLPATFMRILNVSAYKFVSLDDIDSLRGRLRARAKDLGLKGTILLAPEGINLFVAGLQQQVERFLAQLTEDARFAGIETKLSWSEEQPFNRMLVRLKREIITMKHPLIKPELGRAPSVPAPVLKRWLDQGHDDEGRPVVMLDTRNDFEVDVGTFNKIGRAHV